MRLGELTDLFARVGCTQLYAKPLAPNDNSKNQVYFGPNFQALNLFHTEAIAAATRPTGKPIFKARLPFGWLQRHATIASAPGAQLILYPQYPEVRFSGFLAGCEAPPSDLMASREEGRILFLGVVPQKLTIGFVVDRAMDAAHEFRAQFADPTTGVFFDVPLRTAPTDEEATARLLAELHRIHHEGWIDSKQLDGSGRILPCTAPQCGGFTLEAELGIPKNSVSEPDFLGWEVKQHAVSGFDRDPTGVITLMTPEPTVGFYKEHGVAAFIRRFGYADKKGRADRLNFGGIHRAGIRHKDTHLTLTLSGYDVGRGKITDATGSVALIDDTGEIAAAWPFAGLLAHWSRKHAKAAYVPSQMRPLPQRQYRYGNRIRLCRGADPLLLLSALASGAVYYDPGIKLENASTARPVIKRRSQFRITSKALSSLYSAMRIETV